MSRSPIIDQNDINRFCQAAGQQRDDSLLSELLEKHGPAILNQGHQPGGYTPVQYAANWGHADLVEWLIEKGADIHIRAEKGWTTLMAAAWHTGTPEAVAVLLEKGADIDAVDDENKTARMVAEEQRQAKVIELIDRTRGERKGREAEQAVKRGLDHAIPCLKPLKLR